MGGPAFCITADHVQEPAACWSSARRTTEPRSAPHQSNTRSTGARRDGDYVSGLAPSGDDSDTTTNLPIVVRC